MTCHIKEYPLYLFVGACHKKKKIKKKKGRGRQSRK